MARTMIRWKKPQLIVLARTRPAEAILIQCKSAPGPNAPNPYAYDDCTRDEFAENCDKLCSGRSAS
jgi:hypothetical protein